MIESFPPLVDQAIVISGATASGKSEVAIRVAEAINGEILSLDSIAVYRGMDIGTAKPTLADQARVRHHLIDLVDPNEDFSVAKFLEHAHQCVAEIRSRGRVPIFVGGTPMFLKGVLRGFDPGPPADWEFRNAVEADVKQHGIQMLRERLRQVDPLAAHRIEEGDVRRMIRALEVARHTGTPLSHRQTQFERGRDAANCLVFSLHWPREVLHQRIELRVKKMLDDGLVDEVRGLVECYTALSRTASQAVGYREILDYLAGEMALEEAQYRVLVHTRQLARRQETWLRSFSEVRPIEMNASICGEDSNCSTQIAKEIVQAVASRGVVVGAFGSSV